jgi:transcriptional regulator with XRE-family HTH domain
MREACGWTITAAAAQLGVSRGTYRTWERGHATPTPDHQRAYADLLDTFAWALREGV